MTLQSPPVLDAELTEPPALTVRQVAALLQTNTDKVRAMIHEGSIPAVKLSPGAGVGASEWRVPRAALDHWLGPWRSPSTVAVPASPRDASATLDGGPSRETLRDRAGLDPDPGPSSTYPAFDAATDAPSGSVPPVHPEDAAPRPVVRLQGLTTLPEHPSERYLPEEERARLADDRPPRSRPRPAVDGHSFARSPALSRGLRAGTPDRPVHLRRRSGRRMSAKAPASTRTPPARARRARPFGTASPPWPARRSCPTRSCTTTARP